MDGYLGARLAPGAEDRSADDDDVIDLGPEPEPEPVPPPSPAPLAERIAREPERASRNRARTRALRERADVEDGPLEPMRRDAADLHDEAADTHERVAARLERDPRSSS